MNKKDYLKTDEGKSLSHEGIKDIELILENCEILTIPRNMIGEIVLQDFGKIFARTAVNNISLYETCHYVIIQIRDSSQCYEGTHLTIGSTNDKEKHSLLERLKYNDITSIRVNFLWDDESYNWYVDWESKEHDGTVDYNDTINALQKTGEYLGDIWIAIGKEALKELNDYLLTKPKRKAHSFKGGMDSVKCR